MKYFGIDYGQKRIGLATSDEAGKLAFPLATVAAGPKALAEVAAHITQSGAKKVIIGESHNFKNQPNPVQEDIEQFKKDLQELTGLSVVYQPEFLTSAQAGRGARDKRGEKIAETKNLDASAAALILQGFLDTLNGNGRN
jgi:putative Holliday junction resolvase